MARTVSEGTCQLCQGVFKKNAMTRHLAKCLPAHEIAGRGLSQSKTKKTTLFQVQVQGRYLPQYWLHVEVPATASLEDLDDFLRHIWLECCGHLSRFQIGERSYSVQPLEEAWGEDFQEHDMRVPVGKVLHAGCTFAHEYDFGSTTELTLKVLTAREAPASKNQGIRLLARNNPPVYTCSECGAPAAWIDTERAWDGDGWLCAKCSEGKEMLLPLVNSPRTGVCGYTG
jgi:Plasmid pRiA4b ORF-3-like protein